MLTINLQLFAAGESADEKPGAGPKERCRPPETAEEVSSGPETKRGSWVEGRRESESLPLSADTHRKIRKAKRT